MTVLVWCLGVLMIAIVAAGCLGIEALVRAGR